MRIYALLFWEEVRDSLSLIIFENIFINNFCLGTKVIGLDLPGLCNCSGCTGFPKLISGCGRI